MLLLFRSNVASFGSVVFLIWFRSPIISSTCYFLVRILVVFWICTFNERVLPLSKQCDFDAIRMAPFSVTLKGSYLNI